MLSSRLRRTKCVEMCQMFHTTTFQLAEKMMSALKRRFYVHPSPFLRRTCTASSARTYDIRREAGLVCMSMGKGLRFLSFIEFRFDFLEFDGIYLGLKIRSTSNSVTSYFYIGLILVCIDADLCRQILIFQHFSRSNEIYKICNPLYRSDIKF